MLMYRKPKPPPHLVSKKLICDLQRGNDMIKQKISKKLIDCKIPTHLMGFDYLKEAIELVYLDATYKSKIMERLYPSIAEKFNSKPTRVERAIRNALAVADIHKSNSTFIFDCTEDLKNNQ